ncbi:MAG: hypothetical protein QN131_03655 [Armatimonadota bacterium]|nr:hypothetical protein [Armatimonadota bacterium]MDR7549018.1 hypothetical protein [Armatimonadota bacterium]
MIVIPDLLALPRLIANLDRFLGQHLTLDQTKAVIRQRLQTREERFLDHVSRYIYGYPRSPYLPLLRLAGCEFGDLQTMVRQRGLEGTLASLRDAGVYVSFEEFKGRKPVVRAGHTFHFTQRDFDNPFRGAELKVLTGGSRSAGAPIHVALDTVAENRVHCFNLMLESAGARRGPLMTWLPGFPSGSGFFLWMGLTHIGRPPIRWFAMYDPRRPSVSRQQRAILPLARVIARRHGLRMPMPEFTPLSDASPVLKALLDARRRYGGCALITTSSAAVRVAGLASQLGESLEDIKILVGSEPLTSGKAEEIRRTGASVHVRYIFTEGGAAGTGCGTPSAPDDMHFMADSFALIPHRRSMEGVGSLDTYMFTSLLNFAPKVMLNVESDDFGELTVRRCGCPLDDLGLHRHLAYVRSFTKLTGEGAKVLATDCVRIIEEVLPREFGGTSVDYQLLETEDDQRVTRLFLVVSPEVGPLDEQKVLERFTSELLKVPFSGAPATWFQDQTIRVVRRRPVETPSGKLLPFHTQALSLLQERTAAGGSARGVAR